MTDGMPKEQVIRENMEELLDVCEEAMDSIIHLSLPRVM